MSWESHWISTASSNPKSHCDRLTHTMPAADFDRTGQVLWPGARLLAEYLHSLPPNFFLDRSACEIGSGTGLVGLLCGQFCDTILTDHSSLVLDLLRDNTALNPTRHSVRWISKMWTVWKVYRNQYFPSYPFLLGPQCQAGLELKEHNAQTKIISKAASICDSCDIKFEFRGAKGESSHNL